MYSFLQLGTGHCGFSIAGPSGRWWKFGGRVSVVATGGHSINGHAGHCSRPSKHCDCVCLGHRQRTVGQTRAIDVFLALCRECELTGVQALFSRLLGGPPSNGLVLASVEMESKGSRSTA